MAKYVFYSFQKSFTAILISGLLLVGCNTSKKGVTRDKSVSAEAVIVELTQNEIQASWLDAKAKLSYDDGDMSVRGTANIRLQKDTLIWMSVKKLGFEVARLQVTTDSVYVLDRINSMYGIFDLGYLEKTYNLPADFQLLQTVILGNAWFPDRTNPTVQSTPEAFILSEKTPMRQLSYRIHSSTFRLEEMSVAEPLTNRSVRLQLGKYLPTSDKQLFAYFRTLKIESPETGSISMEMEFSDVTLNEPKRTRFEIPERYSRMD
ncbi:MAG: DUF4292 domain-containing protein [Saprospiraceae bacterium]|nr:DUF4292 domain-containing protein [Saprospiraceae bacterium]